MATKELIKTVEDDFEGNDLLLYLNSVKKHSYTDFATAIVGLGTGVTGTVVKKKIAKEIAEKLCPILEVIGYAITVSQFITMIQDNIEAEKLEKVLKNMDVANDTLRVTTETYLWLSGSGNHTGYTTEVTYEVI